LTSANTCAVWLGGGVLVVVVVVLVVVALVVAVLVVVVPVLVDVGGRGVVGGVSLGGCDVSAARAGWKSGGVSMTRRDIMLVPPAVTAPSTTATSVTRTADNRVTVGHRSTMCG
jgi:hypothetical protein